MRHVLPLLLGLAALGACSSNSSAPVSAAPPTVSYRVNGSDISQANLSASEYCRRFGTGAQYQGMQQTPSGTVASYSCTGPSIASGSSVPPEMTEAPPQPCADFLHQSRPGGSDYAGPPVAGCPPTR